MVCEKTRNGSGSPGKDWETLVTGFIKDWEENNSGVDMFHFDSDEDFFCVYSQYIDDISLFSRVLRKECDDEKLMFKYLGCGFKEMNKQNGSLYLKS